MLIAFGDESRERVVETAVTSKEGSRRAKCPVLTEGGLCASLCLGCVLWRLHKVANTLRVGVVVVGGRGSVCRF